MRILHLISRLDGYGGSRLLRLLVEWQASTGDEPTVAALSADHGVVERLRDRGVEIQVFGGRGAWDVLSQARWAQCAARCRADVIHAWGLRALGAATIVARRRAAPPSVATLGWPDAARPWARRIVKTAQGRVTHFAAADPLAAAWLADQWIAAENVRSIPLAAPAPAAEAPSREQLWRELDLPSDTRAIATVGPLIRARQVDEVIWHFELVRVLHPTARLLVAGDGPDRARLERFALQVSEPDAVRFLGYRHDVPGLLRHVDVFWQTGASPTTPWALLEAMAAGAPIVAADVPAHRAVVAPQVSGMLVPSGNRAEVTRATDQLLSDPGLARGLRQAAAEAAAQRPIETTWTALQQMYALAEGARAAPSGVDR